WHWSEAVHTTGFVPRQAPAAQVSVCVQALPSSQGAPSALAGLLQAPVAGLPVAGGVRWSEGAHATGFVPRQAPAWQVSLCVQALPSSQGAPLGLAGLLQAPVAGLHVPAEWHWSEAVHTTGFVPRHAPAWQVSLCVQSLPSSQGAPLDLTGLLQAPVAGLQVPAEWHWSEAVHTTGFVPTQAPAWQVSVCVQSLPSSQGAPSDLAGLRQVPVAWSLEPEGYGSSREHPTGSAPPSFHRWQVSVCVQSLPSSQGAPSGLAGLVQAPVAGLQVPAVWHWSEAVHATGFVPTQAPA